MQGCIGGVHPLKTPNTVCPHEGKLLGMRRLLVPGSRVPAGGQGSIVEVFVNRAQHFDMCFLCGRNPFPRKTWMAGAHLQGGVAGCDGGVRLVHLEVGGSQIAVQLAQALGHAIVLQQVHRLHADSPPIGLLILSHLTPGCTLSIRGSACAFLISTASNARTQQLGFHMLSPAKI